jgi:hypothetical protein
MGAGNTAGLASASRNAVAAGASCRRRFVGTRRDGDEQCRALEQRAGSATSMRHETPPRRRWRRQGIGLTVVLRAF